VSERPDVDALDWGAGHELIGTVTAELWDDAGRPIERQSLAAAYRPDPLVRARVLDDLGEASAARALYSWAVRHGPRRGQAAKTVFTSGLIHRGAVADAGRRGAAL
jgi:hypothetical protein